MTRRPGRDPERVRADRRSGKFGEAFPGRHCPGNPAEDG